MTRERLQKILAAAGLGSRRGCERMIEDGRVEVNGSRAILGSSADPDVDKIRVDGTPLPVRPRPRTFAIHKPRGIISSLAAQGDRSTIRDLLPFPGRFYPVGRLDMDSEGLILLTNDGDLAQRISHPRFEVEKEYQVLLARRPTDEQLTVWRRGVVLEDGFKTAAMAVKFESTFGRGAWIRVIMHEGRKHELRDIGRTIGLPVVRIIRKRIGGLTLGDLKPGAYRELTEKETGELHTFSETPIQSGFVKAASGVKSVFRRKTPKAHPEFTDKQKKGGFAKTAYRGKPEFRKRAARPPAAHAGKPKRGGPGNGAPRGKPAFHSAKKKIRKG